MKNYLFPLLFFATIVIAIGYLSRRTAFIFGCKPTWFYIGYTLLLVATFVFTFGGASAWTNNAICHILFCIFSTLLGVLLYLLLIMIVVDIVQLFAHFSPRIFGTIVSILTTVICTGGIINAFTPRLTPVSVELPNLQQPVRAVLLTDTHLGHFRGQHHLQKIVRKVNAAKPDIIFFTGDCFESGNHDGYVGTDSVKALLRQVGVHVLETETVEDHGLQIVGLDYMRADEQDGNSMHAPVGDATIESVCKELIHKGDLPLVVLHHNPCGGQYLEKAGVDLYLAGHTHGGQLYPLIWINGRLFQFNRGLYRLGNMQAYTSCGTGTFGPPMRIGTRSEITVMEMKGK